MHATLTQRAPQSIIEWDHATHGFVTGIAVEVAKRNWNMFAGIARLVSREDLVAQGISAVWRARGSFDPSKSSFSNWSYTVAHRSLLTLRRDLNRRLKRDHASTAMPPTKPADDQYIGEEPEDLARWMLDLYVEILRTYKDDRVMRRVGGTWLGRAQSAVILALKQRTGLNNEHVAAMFAQHRVVRDALDLPKAPTAGEIDAIERTLKFVGFCG